MKATDLMIGDYIQDLAGDLCQVIVLDRQVAQVETLTGVHQGDTTRYLHEAEGVPLTRDILEKNGFVCVEVGDNGPGTPAKFRNRFEKWECRTQWHTFHVFIDRITNRYSMNAVHSNHIEGMQYVHELQHALRLCGIDKEITL